ncbi:MAG: MerR family regulatory protein [Actinomycetia bacterium]|nr:MerR family regulatory protein [Actinomycetes bacterium]
MATTDDEWRIDDLAHRAGVTVDTIRYYQREKLLPAAEKSGRNKIYGPAHLERISRIRELQDRRFSLAAIRALIEGQRTGLADGVFGGSEHSYTLEQLAERSGASPEIVQAARDSKLIRDPADYGRQTYDSADLDLFLALVQVSNLGVPPAVLTALGRIYTEGVETMQHQVVALFAGDGPVWEPGALEHFQATSNDASADLLPVVNRIVNHVHLRTLQRLTLEAIENSATARAAAVAAPEAKPAPRTARESRPATTEQSAAAKDQRSTRKRFTTY